MQHAIADPSSESWPGERSVQVVLEIAPRGDCFMDHLEGDIADVEMHFPNGDCQCDVTVCREEGAGHCVDIVHHSREVCRNCPGIVFSEYDLVPRFLDRDEEQFVVRTYLPADHQLSELVGDLREVSEWVRVLRIVDVDDDAGAPDVAEIDLTRLTDKQRDALLRAVDRGYYETPQAVSLDELAEEFGVSKSALSQRLTRAEGTVMAQLF
jgi:AraC-like DNA-binding protein